MDLKHITLEVCEIAGRAGNYLVSERKKFRKEDVMQKNTHDYVSYVDREAEKMIVKELGALLPEAGFITEEGTMAQTKRELNWIIDPLDGTTNFIHDYAPYCVSIALRREKELLVGVVYEVCRNECFYAWKGGKAFLDGKQINVSGNKLEEAFIGLELPYNTEQYRHIALNAINELYGKVAGIRMNGSAAMGLCYVAAGRYDAWGEAFIKVWDYSAGALIVREAGGIVTDFAGGDDLTSTHHVIATNGIIHDQFREVLALETFE